VISGPPGAGKTTIARRVAQRLPAAAHIEGDAIQDMIVAGGLHPQQEPRAEAERQLRLRTTNVSLLADSFAAAGITPVIDDTVVVRARLAHYLEDLRTRPVRLVLLAPPLAVSLARDRARAIKQVGHIWAHLDGEMREEMAGIGLWLDTERQTPDETVAAIMARLDEAVVG